MRNAILLHGKPDKEQYYDSAYPNSSDAHWLPWLQKQLVKRDIAAATPEVPLAYDPQYDLWATEADRYQITAETILVGHSCGGGFWVRYLSEHPEIWTGKVVLVAPSLGLSWDNRHFFDFQIDSEIVKRTSDLTIFVSNDDNSSTRQAVQTLMESLPGAVQKDFTGYGHFTLQSMGTTEFPELLEEALA